MAEVNFQVKKGLTVPRGTASTPSIIFDAADTDTGVYSPGANQVAISTNGTGRLFVDANGNVGVGVSSPAEELHIAAADSTIRLEDTSVSGLYHNIIAASNTGLRFDVDPGNVAASSFFRIDIDGGEKARITSDGRLGLGTSNPVTLLHIAASNDPQLRIEATGSSLSDDAQIVIKTTNGEFLIQNDRSLGTSGVLTFNGATNDNLCIDHATGRVGIGTTSPSEALDVSGNVTISGSISKGSGSFKITHPLETKKDTHYLVHSFIEGPRADLIYRGTAKLTNGKAVINLDSESNMTAGTFEALCTNVSCFTSNETDWTPVKGSVSKNKLTIVAQDTASNATVSWLVIGERKDPHMLEANWTDENGRIIVEPEKEEV